MKISGLAIPVDDLSAAIDFFNGQFDLSLKFRDGERYAALDFREMTLALLAGEEKLVDRPAFTVKADDMDTSIHELTQKGATVIQPATQGPHELRAVLSAPGGMAVIVSQKTRSWAG
ncbi:hypothetical protein KXS15_25235 [Sinorhizobium meliloti]|uniref:VOC family protein n=1 Tax=Rhizobium meliloti TaxID=382 RepID=UPI003F18B15A